MEVQEDGIIKHTGSVNTGTDPLRFQSRGYGQPHQSHMVRFNESSTHTVQQSTYKMNRKQGTLFNFLNTSSMSQKNDDKTGIVPGKKRKPFIRHYNHEYIKYGFILWPNSTEEDIRPMCIICHEVLVNDAMKPAKMLRHLKAKHSELEKKPREYFERRKQELGLQTKTFKQNFIHNKSLLKCSYLVALRIAKTRKSFTTGENLIKPVLIDVCLEMFGLSAVDKIKSIPLSNDTIRRRIEKLSENVEYQLIQKIKESTLFAIQIDESCDISKKAILIFYLAGVLVTEKTDTYGTVNKTRKDLPVNFSKEKVPKGEIVAYQRGKVMALKWQDKKSVCLMSTIHDASSYLVTCKSKKTY
ncbi:zinc finger MYM-type protein 6 [Trichonephila clavata]|uniref:Zinc finger MYM-type protein 6 n=1 Tax=Trichonephila clavata TaxID=2740835 RepID=A0A8X6FTW8_TRICU|nr:zinc finger MYM-type protein 6 [Trichonephila clavata]